MTTRPKGRKFRIRRGFGTASVDTQAGQSPEAEGSDAAAPDASEATGARAAAGAAAEAPPARSRKSSAAAAAVSRNDDPEIAAIKAEGLTGRQLRVARRTALKHGITASSDHDAVRQLRARGVDPFARSNMLELIVSEDEKANQTASANVPATRPTTDPAAPRAPGQPLDEASRAAEIMAVQRDIAKRRRRRLALLGTRLAFFVLLPTLIAGYYFFVIATPLYATNSAFKIDTADSASSGGGLGGLFSGTGLANATDSIVVQEYLESRVAMLRLDEELGFREHFSNPDIDPLTRLAPDATDEEMYDTYRSNLDIGFDPTEGLIRMEVRATDAETSQAFSEALIRYAEEQVNAMSVPLLEGQMAGARASYEEAEAQLLASQQRVLELQEQRGVLSTDAEVSTIFQQISTFELQLQEERLRLAELLSVDRPNQTRVEVSRQNIARLEEITSDLRGGLTTADGEEVSLARISSELVVAQADMETRQVILAQALQQMETARIEANRQSLYLLMSVYPVPPDAAAYPRAFENTLLTLLVFTGIYLLLAMTASILREQISS